MIKKFKTFIYRTAAAFLAVFTFLVITASILRAEDGLVGYWSFDESSTNSVIDLAGENNGVMYGDAKRVPGIIGKAVQFDGDGDYVKFGDVLDPRTNDQTIIAWIKTDAQKFGAMMPISKYRTIPGPYHGFYWNFVNEFKNDFYVVDNQGNYVNAEVTENLRDDEWHQVAMVINNVNEMVSIYIDGHLSAASSGIFDDVDTSYSLYLGCRNYSPNPMYFSGMIDEVKIYNYALSPSEILAEADALSADQAPPTVSISVFPEEVKQGEPVTVTVTGTDDNGLAAIWWWGSSTGDPELDKAHWYPCSGTHAAYTWTIDTSNLAPGRCRLGANSRDAAYPVPGEPHQASEGAGIAYASFTVSKPKADLVMESLTTVKDSLDAGTDRELGITAGFRCDGTRDNFIDKDGNGSYTPGTDLWLYHDSVEEPFRVSLKVNGKLLKDVAVTYSPLYAGTGWRINFGSGLEAQEFAADFYKMCVPGTNEIRIKVDGENSIEETDETNNELIKTITVADSMAPDVSFIYPGSGQEIKNAIQVEAAASDNVAVEKVELYIDGNKISDDMSAPYAWGIETHSYENGVHIFRIVASDTFGNISSAQIPVEIKNDRPQAWIKIPKPEKRLRGNAVTVMANVTDHTYGVQFQYRKTLESGDGGEEEIVIPPDEESGGEEEGGDSQEEQNPWVDISSLDTRKPFSVYWNTTQLDNGRYNLRAVAYDRFGYADPEPEYIDVIIDDVNWDIHEDGNPEVDPNKQHCKKQRFSKNEDTTVELADGTQAIIPAGINVGGGSIEISIVNSREMEKIAPPKESSLKPAGVYREYNFSDGTRLFNKHITLVLPYPDEDGDGILDGTDIKATDLAPYWYDEDEDMWRPVKGASVNTVHALSAEEQGPGRVVVNVDHFTLFALMAVTPKSDLKDVIVYPNPYKPNSGLGHDIVSFDGLTDKAVVDIYTISGRLVTELEGHTVPGRIEWDSRNEDGEKLASGIYLYVVRDGENSPATGKLAIIR